MRERGAEGRGRHRRGGVPWEWDAPEIQGEAVSFNLALRSTTMHARQTNPSSGSIWWLQRVATPGPVCWPQLLAVLDDVKVSRLRHRSRAADKGVSHQFVADYPNHREDNQYPNLYHLAHGSMIQCKRY